MRTLGVCGDSYMSATQDLNRSDCKGGIHYTELLSKRLGYNYKTFARGGCSNYCISHQVEQMVLEGVDLIIVGFTCSTRIDIPIRPVENLPQNIFDFDYVDYPDLSATDERFSNNPNIISDSITNIVNYNGKFHGHSLDHYKKILNGNVEPLLNNINNFINGGFSDLLFSNDMRSISHTLNVLKRSKIPYIWYWSHDKDVFSDEMYMVSGDLCPVTYTSHEGSYRFHTTEESQITLCNLWMDYIESDKDHFLI